VHVNAPIPRHYRSTPGLLAVVAVLVLVGLPDLCYAPRYVDSEERRRDRIRELREEIQFENGQLEQLNEQTTEVQGHFDTSKERYDKATAQLEQLQTELTTTRKELTEVAGKWARLVKTLRTKIESDPALIEARRAAERAQADYHIAREALVKKLTTENAGYRDGLDQREELQRRLTLYTQSDASVEREIQQMRAELIVLDQKLTQLLNAAAAKDETIRRTHAALEQANAVVRKRHAEVEAQLLAESGHQGLTERQAELRKHIVTLNSKLAEVRREQAVAKRLVLRAESLRGELERKTKTRQRVLGNLQEELQRILRRE